jgi:hypothetical protein
MPSPDKSLRALLSGAMRLGSIRLPVRIGIGIAMAVSEPIA